MTNKSKFKNDEELCDELLQIFPDGAVERDNLGQIIIYTGLRTDPKDQSTLIAFSGKEENDD